MSFQRDFNFEIGFGAGDRLGLVGDFSGRIPQDCSADQIRSRSRVVTVPVETRNKNNTQGESGQPFCCPVVQCWAARESNLAECPAMSPVAANCRPPVPASFNLHFR